MPNLNITLQEVNQSISRPTIFDIIAQLQDITKLDKDSKIFFAGDSKKILTPGTDIDSTTERYAIFNTDKYNFIEVEEDFDKEAINTTPVSKRDYLPVFYDTNLGVSVAPIYATTLVTINFNYRWPSKGEAERWRNDLRANISNRRDMNLHSINYHYPVSDDVIWILKEIHAKRESYLGYGQTFEQYIQNFSTSRLTILTDLVNKNFSLAVTETQMEIIGLYDFEGMPDKIERDDNTGTYNVSFSYKFSYEKPIMCNIRYPIIIHNQLLPKYLVDFGNTEYDNTRVNKSYSLSLGSLSDFRADNIINQRLNREQHIKLPYFDDYVLGTIPTGTGSVFTALCEVDTTDKKTLLNLNELGDILIDNDIIDFIKNSERSYICRTYMSILNISVYKNHKLMDMSKFSCDTNLNIKHITELDLRQQYRVRLSILIDLTYFTNRQAIARLKANSKVFVKIIGSMNEILANNMDFVNLGNKSCITEATFNSIYGALAGFDMPGYHNHWAVGQKGNNNFGLDSINNYGKFSSLTDQEKKAILEGRQMAVVGIMRRRDSDVRSEI